MRFTETHKWANNKNTGFTTNHASPQELLIKSEESANKIAQTIGGYVKHEGDTFEVWLTDKLIVRILMETILPKQYTITTFANENPTKPFPLAWAEEDTPTQALASILYRITEENNNARKTALSKKIEKEATHEGEHIVYKTEDYTYYAGEPRKSNNHHSPPPRSTTYTTCLSIPPPAIMWPVLIWDCAWYPG